jgi:uncharacterized membrane protein
MAEFNQENTHSSKKILSLKRKMIYGILLALIFFIAAFGIGLVQGKAGLALSLIGTSIALEAQPAAVLSVPLGFDPLAGGLISILANLILLPLLLLTFNEVIQRWKWLRKRLQKAEKWSVKYGKYGVWILTLLTPFLGAYLCVAVGFLLRWPPIRVFASIVFGVIVSTFLITYGGHGLLSLFK